MKPATTLLLTVLLFSLFPGTNSSAELYPGTDLTPLEFTMTGDPIIYSNYPETIYVEGLSQYGRPMDVNFCMNQLGVVNGKTYANGRHFNRVPVYADQNYTAEIYNGRTASDLTPYTFGIAFINDGTSQATISILKSGQQNSDRAGIVMMALDTHLNFIHSDIHNPIALKNPLYSYPRTVTLKPGEAKIVLFETITKLNGYANGRIQFQTDQDVTLMEFYMLTSVLDDAINASNLTLTQDNLDQINLYPILSEIAQDDNRVLKLEDYPKQYTTTTAVLSYDTRTASLTAPVGTKFCLSNAGHIKGIRDLNTNEYEPLGSDDFGGYPVGENRIHDGNYSIIYDLTLLEAEGKNILITPYKEEGRSTSSGAVLYNSYNGWQLATPNADTWVVPIHPDGNFKFILPGSVYGDILFEIIEPNDSDGGRLAWLDASCSDWARQSTAAGIAAGIVPISLHDRYGSKLTREEFCTLAVTLYLNQTNQSLSDALAKNPVASNFSDTDNEMVYLAHALEIVAGVGNGKFSPDGTITREAAAVMMDHVCSAVGFDKEPLYAISPYADNQHISEWAKNSVYTLSNADLFSGTGNGAFSPKGNLTRQEGIALIYRLFQKL